MTGRLAAAVFFAVASVSTLTTADELNITAAPVSTFENVGVGANVGKLVWRGGLVLTSPSDMFGGLSGIGFTGSDNRLVMVSDRGNFISGRLLYDEVGRPLSVVAATTSPLTNTKGTDLPRAAARDSEGLAVISRSGVPTGIRVSFENLTRVADFGLRAGAPFGAAHEVRIPALLTNTRSNETLESVCIAPPASPVAGATLLIAENIPDRAGNHTAFLVGTKDAGRLALKPADGVRPTDCAFLPNGDLLVLERGVALVTFAMQLRRIPAAELHRGALLTGDVLLQATGGDIDNMEGLAVHPGPDGTTRITLISDNNFNDWERTLLLEFSLPD
jgi:hypothetical protein